MAWPTYWLSMEKQRRHWIRILNSNPSNAFSQLSIFENWQEITLTKVSHRILLSNFPLRAVPWIQLSTFAGNQRLKSHRLPSPETWQRFAETAWVIAVGVLPSGQEDPPARLFGSIDDAINRGDLSNTSSRFPTERLGPELRLGAGAYVISPLGHFCRNLAVDQCEKRLWLGNANLAGELISAPKL